ncbi:hypothetical protein D3C78_1831260 [compost metagenome]
MSNVVNLAENGITPALHTSVDAMQADIWAAIDKAAEHGMPIGLIIGQLEFVKSAMINQHFYTMR